MKAALNKHNLVHEGDTLHIDGGLSMKKRMASSHLVFKALPGLYWRLQNETWNIRHVKVWYRNLYSWI